MPPQAGLPPAGLGGPSTTRAWADTRFRGPSPPSVHADGDVVHSFTIRKNREPGLTATVAVAIPAASAVTVCNCQNVLPPTVALTRTLAPMALRLAAVPPRVNLIQ